MCLKLISVRKQGTATIEVHKDSIDKEDNVLIIDDLIATGGTAEAAAQEANQNLRKAQWLTELEAHCNVRTKQNPVRKAST